MERTNIKENAEEYIIKNQTTTTKLGVWKGLNFSKTIKRILCRKCLARVMKEFGGENPTPENPELYCKYCRARIEKATKEAYGENP